ncbi:putative ribosome biogenesis protein C8F11.04 [Quercus suber]|uniref:Ribosomal l1 domain-containing protein 1 n=1 Tax=Quercus suber TaxID=58331 RepID=A0AAW0JJG9_QUESU|nr:putative ribosome biogenesis protein C8F11.04 [Quercus suber]XP_023879554.1 putative ribosome biogenesis protein C8F11.04 [Quercus suber]XP_023879555.1 putative ribosome biogenesis protein C8F11.04 [Quercus suber]POE76738.1 ribosomal l1 domain-containing protein 1 [Quercus suber]
MAMAIADPNPPPTTSRVSPKTIQKAVKALLKWRDSKSQTQKPQLLSDDEFFYLILTLKKIPTQIRTNPYKIPIPHPLLAQELCLIIDDRSHSNLDKAAAKSKIESEQIPISKVLKLSKLKSDYRPFEAKRKLCDSYDMFFVDKRIVPLMPGLLGKHFYQKKKLPVPVDLTHKNWKEQIERARASALVYLRSGTCCVVKVARLSLGKKEIAENVVAAINGVVEIVPRKWDGVRSLHLRLMESVALPVYQAMPEVTLKAEEVEEVVEKEGKGEEVGVDEGKKGEKVKKKKKGRIHEVRYMDVNIGDVFDEDQLGSDEGEDVGEMGSGELESKKRKKGDKSKTEGKDSGKSKRLKKSDKVKKEDGLKENNDGLLAAKGKKEDGVKGKKVGLSVEDVKSSEKKVKKEDGLKENNDGLLAAKGKREDGVKKKKVGSSVEDVKSSEKKVKNKDGLTENRDRLLATKGRKEDGLKKRKVELPVKDEKSSEKKLKKKKSAEVKLKSGEKEVKPKKSKKAVE